MKASKEECYGMRGGAAISHIAELSCRLNSGWEGNVDQSKAVQEICRRHSEECFRVKKDTV